MPTGTRSSRRTASPAKPRTAKAVVQLSDLSPADRARLADELKAAGPDGTLDESIAAGARRSERIAALLDDRDHLRDCPGGRVEAYSATRPAKPDRGEPSRPLTVVRCIECGGSTIMEKPYTEVVAELVSDDGD